jgi:hypothetical protein
VPALDRLSTGLRPKRPLPQSTSTNKVDERPRHSNSGSDGDSDDRLRPVEQNEKETRHRRQRWKRVKRNPERPIQRIRVMTSMVITSSRVKKQKHAATTPSATNERCGIWWRGWMAARNRK